MTLAPLILAAVLIGLGLSGTFMPPRVKAWMVRWASRPLGLVLCAAVASFQVFRLIGEPDDPIAWMILAFMAWTIWAYLRGRKAKSKTPPGNGDFRMNANLAAILYLVSGVLFILALRGLSSPETSRRRQHLRHGRHGHRRADHPGHPVEPGRARPGDHRPDRSAAWPSAAGWGR